MKLRQILLGAAIAAMPVAAAAADCEIGMGIAPIMEGDQEIGRASCRERV